MRERLNCHSNHTHFQWHRLATAAIVNYCLTTHRHIMVKPPFESCATVTDAVLVAAAKHLPSECVTIFWCRIMLIRGYRSGASLYTAGQGAARYNEL
jgi:hypothetical protein